jgi:hypothetical protein
VGAPRSTRRHVLLLAALTAAIFAFDSGMELGVAAAVPYAVVVSLAYRMQRVRWVWTAAAVCSALAIAGVFLSPAGGDIWKVLANRALALCAIWAPVIPCSRVLSESSERERLATIVESSEDAIIGKTLDGLVTSWNRGAEKLYGYRPGEMIGRPIARIWPEDRLDELAGILERLRRGESVDNYETERLRQDGSRLHVSLTVSLIRDAGGNPAAASAIARDITKRKRLEIERAIAAANLEKRTAELAQAIEALERGSMEMQRFAYVASHDLQTPLRTIAGFAQFLQADYEERLDDRAKDYLRRIVRGAARLQLLIQNLLEFSRVESRAAPFVAVELNDVFSDVLESLHSSIEEGGAVVTRGPLPAVPGDRTQLTQLLQNLIGNGIKYRGPAAPCVHISGEREGGVWTISVRDNGIGIAAEHGEKVFEIFRRLHTAQAYPGTGMGLALCRRIVNRHGGRIWVESGDTGGSAFRFTIPAPFPISTPEPALPPSNGLQPTLEVQLENE